MNRLLKRCICGILTFALIFTSSAFTFDINADAAGYTITKKKMPFYLADETTKQNQYVYFVNGKDIPYMDMDDLTGLYKMIMQMRGFNKYDLKVKKKGNKYILTRENGYKCVMDFKKDKVYFVDYNAFNKSSDENTIMDMVSTPVKDAKGRGIYLKRNASGTVERYGKDITMNLKNYHIDLVRKGNKYYIPLQTYYDIFFWQNNLPLLYNGEAVFLVSMDGAPLIDGEYNRTAYGKLYYKNKLKKKKLSKAMTEFNYNELCFCLDHTYGLKEAHNIKKFSTLMRNTGLKYYFMSGNSKRIDQAMYILSTRYLDDVHTKYGIPSYTTGYTLRENLTTNYGEGPARDAIFARTDDFKEARAKYYPNGVPAYEEIGDTAFITFDEFAMFTSDTDYYKTPPTADAKDTMGIIAYSVQQILRKGSPIKNVVLDLSCNGGGAADTAVYTIAAFLGKTRLSLEDSYTGALVTSSYLCDTNFDHKFDENDYLADKGLNLYCLTSGVSFSCGNLVPCAFKQSGDVTLVGQTTGGGACSVLWVSSAAGGAIRISSPNRLSFLKNGAFYDVDRGADPDIYLAKKQSYFDRKNLASMLKTQK